MFEGEDKYSKFLKGSIFNDSTITNNHSSTEIQNYEYHKQESAASLEIPSLFMDEFNNSNIMNTTLNSLVSIESDDSSKRSHKTNRRIAKNVYLLTEAQHIIDYFILIDSKFELNITDKTRRAITYNLSVIKSTELQQDEFRSSLKSLFDDAYNEVITILFLNSYTNYILYTKNSN